MYLSCRKCLSCNQNVEFMTKSVLWQSINATHPEIISECNTDYTAERTGEKIYIKEIFFFFSEQNSYVSQSP